MYFGFIDVLFRFWDRKVNVTAGSDLKTLWTPYLKNLWRKFHQILVTHSFGFIDMLIRFWSEKVQVKVTAGNDLRTLWIPYLKNH